MVSTSESGSTALPAFASSDPGFDAVPLDALLVEHQALLGRIKLCYGADRVAFERELMPLVHGYAAYVHLLPATPDNYFRTPGGLLHLGLQTAFFALQGTDAHIFSGKATISARRELEPRWRMATFVGGLCCELHRVLSHLIVTTPDGAEWPAFLQPLHGWLQAQGATRYFVRWRPQATEVRGLGLFALPQVVQVAMIQHLLHEDGTIVRQLFASVGGVPQYREHNVLDDLVRRSLALVVHRDLLASADRYGAPQYGSHLERYLVDAMRRLAGGHSAWTANRDKGRLWLGSDGLFLLWPGAAQDMLELLEADQLAGIPKAPDTLLDILLEAGVLQARPDGGRTWSIYPGAAKTATEAVKLASPAILLAGIEPAPVALERAMQSVESPAATISKAKAMEPAKPAGRVVAPVPAAQLSLIEPDPAESVMAPSEHAPDPATAPQSSAPTQDEAMPAELQRFIRLKAPMRLNPGVRQALQEAVDTLNDPPSSSAVFTVREGIFVPLAEFERRGVQPAVAVRALTDAGMLHRTSSAGPPTLSREVNGAAVVGVVLRPSHVGGLDPLAFGDDGEAGH